VFGAYTHEHASLKPCIHNYQGWQVTANVLICNPHLIVERKRNALFDIHIKHRGAKLVHWVCERSDLRASTVGKSTRGVATSVQCTGQLMLCNVDIHRKLYVEVQCSTHLIVLRENRAWRPACPSRLKLPRRQSCMLGKDTNTQCTATLLHAKS
jgi:hypothetical protein